MPKIDVDAQVARVFSLAVRPTSTHLDLVAAHLLPNEPHLTSFTSFSGRQAVRTV